MIKNKILYIFIYTLCISCGIFEPKECDTGCYLEVSAPSLEIDENEYYHIIYQ